MFIEIGFENNFQTIFGYRNPVNSFSELKKKTMVKQFDYEIASYLAMTLRNKSGRMKSGSSV